MSSWFTLYDNTEETSTRFVGYAGETTRFDVAITTTSNFYGKKLVCVIQSGRSAIMDDSDAENVDYVQEAFQLSSHEEALELSNFLIANL